MNINDLNDFLSTTTEKQTDERIENSNRTFRKAVQNADAGKDLQLKKILQSIEETLEREYKFYKVKTSWKDQTEEIVPENLLKDAVDKTVKKLAKVATQYSRILLKIKE